MYISNRSSSNGLKYLEVLKNEKKNDKDMFKYILLNFMTHF